MAYITSLLIIALVLYLVVTPLFKKDTHWSPDEIADDLDEISLEELYATINELEMEYNMGKLPEEDYSKLKRHYEVLAVQKMKEVESPIVEKQVEKEVARAVDDDSVELDQDIDREIAEELRQLRQKRKGK